MNRHPPLARIARLCFVVSVIAILIALIGVARQPPAFFRAYLVAFLYWSAVPLGCLALLMVHNLTSGRWGAWLRAPLEAASGTMPLVALAFVPLLFGLHDLYPWLDPAFVADHPTVERKTVYLNLSFFLVRAAFYFVIWITIAIVLPRMSVRREVAPGSQTEAGTSAIGLILYVLTVSFAAVDWGMSLEPQWYSSAYAPLFAIGQLLAALAFMVLIGAVVAPARAEPPQLIGAGNLLLTLVLLWAYIAYTQYLIVYTAGLPQEISWYLARKGGWQMLALLMIVFHFAVPFLFLLFRGVKQNILLLAGVAALLLIMRVLDLLWTIVPAFHADAWRTALSDIAVFVALGGLWLGYFFHRLRLRLVLSS